MKYNFLDDIDPWGDLVKTIYGDSKYFFYEYNNTQTKETDDGYEIVKPIPGIKKENVSIQMKGENLIIEIKESNSFVSQGKETYLLKKADKNKITAKIEDGILTVKVSYKEEEKPLDINID